MQKLLIMLGVISVLIGILVVLIGILKTADDGNGAVGIVLGGGLFMALGIAIFALKKQ